MKKSTLTLVAVAVTGFCTTFAFAGNNEPYHNDKNGHYMQGQNQTMTPEQKQARQDFMEDTASLRQSLASKKGEYRAVMAATNPDVKAAGKLAGEIAGLKNQLREKAVAAGLPFHRGMGGMGMGMGSDMGNGGHGHNGGHGSKGNNMGNCNW